MRECPPEGVRELRATLALFDVSPYGTDESDRLRFPRDVLLDCIIKAVSCLRITSLR